MLGVALMYVQIIIMFYFSHFSPVVCLISVIILKLLLFYYPIMNRCTQYTDIIIVHMMVIICYRHNYAYSMISMSIGLHLFVYTYNIFWCQ